MAFKPHYRLTCNGSIDGEKVSFGLSAVGDESALVPSMWEYVAILEVANQAATDFATFCTSMKPSWGTRTTFTGVRATAFNDAGLVSAVADKLFAAPIVGTGSTTLPSFCSVVATLLTDRAGKSFRGRMYIPHLDAGTLTTTGQLASGTVTAYAGFVSTLISGLNNAPGLDTVWNGFKVCVASRGGERPAVRPGANTIVKRVRMDSKIDTQRRRMNDTIPASTATTTPTGT